MKHWRGQCALLPTLLLTALVLRFGLGWLQESVPSKGIEIWVVITLAIFFWQLVGTSRATDKFLKDTGNMISVYCAYFVLLIIAVLTTVQVADAVASKAHSIEIVETPRSMLAVIGADTVVVDGNLDWDVYSAFDKTLDTHPKIEHVYLASSGGYVFVARAMALKILERRLNTHVSSHCYSACTIAFLAGDRRTMASSAQLGFHRYKLESTSQPIFIDVSEELEKDRLFFAERGLTDAFIQKVFTAEHTELWKPDMVALIKGGVFD